MKDEDKLQEFAAWLASRGIELTVSDRRIAVGFLALAGRRPVCAEDIVRGSELARDASMTNGDELARVGGLLLQFEAVQAAAPSAAAEVDVTAGGTGTTSSEPPLGGAEAEGLATALAEVSAANGGDAVRVVATTAPMKVMIRASGPLPASSATGARATSGPIRASSISPVSRPSHDPGEPRAIAVGRWRLRAAALVGLGALAVGALAIGATRSAAHTSAAEGSAAPRPSAAAPVADKGQRLRRVAIEVRLPAGWREAGDAELGALASQADATLVLPGGAPAGLDRGLFVAMAPAGGDLVDAARNAERGAIRQLGMAALAYGPEGCELVDLGGAPTGRCLGLAERGAGRSTVAVAIYVRAVGERNVVALALGGATQGQTRSDTDAIIASFRP